MNRLFMILSIGVMLNLPVYSQERVNISGFIKDKKTGELLIGASIVDSVSNRGYISDYNGYFSITVQIPAKLKFSYVGYSFQNINLKNKIDTFLNIQLNPGTELEEITIKTQRKYFANTTSLNTKEIAQIPSLGGKPDVSKSIQLLPGISTQTEGSSLLIVRGGDPGQNLYLFDNVPVIYVNHLGGFMSVFNPDIINNIDVYKGGFPSRYGGKLSSIVDITQKEGDISGRKGSFGIGLTDASFSVEGPLKLKNTSFIVSGRKTLIDPLLALASNLSYGNDFIISYGFHDINGKLTWKPNLKNSFSFNVYHGDDYVYYWSDPKRKEALGKHKFSYKWGNLLLSAHWKYALSSKAFFSGNISYTRYRYKENYRYTFPEIADSVLHKKYLSSVQDFSLRTGLKYSIWSNYSIETGLQSSLLLYLPNYYFHGIPSLKKIITSNESAFYFDNKFMFFDNSQFTAGFRLTNYHSSGYNDISFEPRLNLNIGIMPRQILNLSYMHVKQSSHLLFTSGNFFANEVWVPAGQVIPPSSADQYTLGWCGSINDNMFSSEINFFYKKMNDLISYKEGFSNLKGTEFWQTKIENIGSGRSKGFEFFLKKNYGKLTGFTSYTISKTLRTYPEINNGREFLFDYDRLHSFSISSNYMVNEKINLNFTWIYQTGLPYTPAVGRQLVPSLEPDENGNDFYYEVLIYGERNSMRMRDYHRLDIGLNYEKVTRNGRKAVWSFSIYNCYNRQNPYFYYYNNNNSGEIFIPEYGEESKPLALYQRSFFPILPTFSYKLFFDRNINKKVKQRFKNWLYHKN